MQQDNDPKHRRKSTTEWLQQKKIGLLERPSQSPDLLEWPSQSPDLLERPSQSPDLNPIEMLWHDLKRAVHTRHPKNIAELNQFCKEEWSKIRPDCYAGLICNYRKCLVEVIAAKVGSSSY
jgi:transposase